MATAPAPTDIIKDPVTGNQYYRTSPTDTYKPYVPEVVPMSTTPTTSTKPPSTTATTGTKVSPEDQAILGLGVTQEQLNQLNTGDMDPLSFNALIGQVETKLKTDNDLVTQRGYLIKHLYDDPLTKDELKALPEDIQRVVGSGDKNTIELQIRLLNDQIAGRGNTLTQSIKYLADGYKEAASLAEEQKQNAIDNVLRFVDEYGSNASAVLGSLYGPEYLEKLKEMGIDIEGMASIETLAQIKAREDALGGGGSLLTDTQVQTGAVNARMSIEEFQDLPTTVQSYFYRNPKLESEDGEEITFANWVENIVDAVESGDATVQEAIDSAEASGMPAEVVTYIKGRISGTSAPAAKAPSSGFLKSLWGAIKGVGRAIID